MKGKDPTRCEMILRLSSRYLDQVGIKVDLTGDDITFRVPTTEGPIFHPDYLTHLHDMNLKDSEVEEVHEEVNVWAARKFIGKAIE